MTLQLTPWQNPPGQLGLATESVHLWRFPLLCQEAFEPLLDEQELHRARRLRAPGKAQAFVVARARLRQILAGYLAVDPKTLRFSYGPSGKPELKGLTEPLFFNLTHSGEWGLCAVTRQGEVGVDIERLDRRVDYEKLAAGFFSANERECLQAASSHRRRRLFFRLWTRKEAWLKGKGGGFTEPDRALDQAHLQGSYTCDGSWWLRSFPVTRHYLATLALSREVSLLQRWDLWTPPR